MAKKQIAKPAKAGHYSAGLKAGNLVFVSGQLSLINRETLEKPTTIEAETLLALEKVEKILSEYGLNRNNIVKTTAFITKPEYWDEANEAYIQFFGDHKPTRSIIPVGPLYHGCNVEIEAIAIIE